VILPFVDHSEEPARETPALTLDRLEEAFAHLGSPVAPADQEGAAKEEVRNEEAGEEVHPENRRPESRPAASQPAESPAPPSRGRRPRRNRSASRPQGAANETSVEHHEVAPAAATGHTHEAKAPGTGDAQAPKAASQPASEPIILGVGVPASEL
jgi:ribonuclease E